VAKAEVWFWLHTTLNHQQCDIYKQKDQLWSLMASSESVQGFIKRQTSKQPKLVQVDKVVHIEKCYCVWQTVNNWFLMIHKHRGMYSILKNWFRSGLLQYILKENMWLAICQKRKMFLRWN